MRTQTVSGNEHKQEPLTEPAGDGGMAKSQPLSVDQLRQQLASAFAHVPPNPQPPRAAAPEKIAAPEESLTSEESVSPEEPVTPEEEEPVSPEETVTSEEPLTPEEPAAPLPPASGPFTLPPEPPIPPMQEQARPTQMPAPVQPPPTAAPGFPAGAAAALNEPAPAPQAAASPAGAGATDAGQAAMAEASPAAGARPRPPRGDDYADIRQRTAFLLDVMARPDSAAQPQERALAGDALLAMMGEIRATSPRLVHRIAERLCMMDKAPSRLVRAVLDAGDEATVREVLLEARIMEEQLAAIAARAPEGMLEIIAMRRNLPPVVCDEIMNRKFEQPIMRLLRNRQAVISERSYWRLLDLAVDIPSLYGPMVARDDLPSPVAFELFWHVSPMQRRLIISRFLGDSGLLDKLLPIVGPVVEQGGAEERAMRIEAITEMLATGELDAAATKMMRVSGLDVETCQRLISDCSGEPLAIFYKAMGYARRAFPAVLQKLAAAPGCPLDGGRDLNELHMLFDSLSLNKARVMLIYWNWAQLGAGPYSCRANCHSTEQEPEQAREQEKRQGHEQAAEPEQAGEQQEQRQGQEQAAEPEQAREQEKRQGHEQAAEPEQGLAHTPR